MPIMPRPKKARALAAKVLKNSERNQMSEENMEALKPQSGRRQNGPSLPMEIRQTIKR